MIRETLDFMRDQLKQLQDQFTRRFERDFAHSERLKVLLAAVAAILLLSSLVAVSRWSNGVLQEYRTKQLAYARLKTQVEARVWPERRAQSVALKLALEERLWMASTPGLAQAEFDRWLRDHLGRYKMDPQSIQVHLVPLLSGTDRSDRGQAALADVQRMTAKVMVTFDQTALLSFLDDIAESDKAVVIDRLMVHAGRNARVEMDVTTFFPFHEPRS